jgi:predicted DNA-binding transcriptional regulator AlpA
VGLVFSGLSALVVDCIEEVAGAIVVRLLRLPLPDRPVAAVIGVDDFALRKRHTYATVIINALTRERIDVLPDRRAETLQAWLRRHPDIEVVCRDSSGAYAEAIRRALPDAVHVADRWHIWHNLAEAALKEVAAHSRCWGKTGPPPRDGKRAGTTRERWQQVHDLIDRGAGLLETARRLNLALNTVKRYARIPEPERLVRAPQYRPTLVDPFRDYLRQRRQDDPAVPVLQLLKEIRDLGYTASQNLLYRYITQGRVECDRPAISPRRLTRYLLTLPERLKDHQREWVDAATAGCSELMTLSTLISDFAALLTPPAATTCSWTPGSTRLVTPTSHTCTPSPAAFHDLATLPTVIDVTTAARALGLSRTYAYELVKRDEFPCRILRVGHAYRVPTAELLAVLGVERAALATMATVSKRSEPDQPEGATSVRPDPP